MSTFFKKIFFILGNEYKKTFFLLVFFSLIVSIVEMFGIAIIMPFMNMANDFSIIQNNEKYKFIFDLFNFNSELNFIYTFGVVLILFYSFRGIMNISYTYLLAKFSKGSYHNISKKLLDNYLSRSYYSFTSLNSSILTKSIINEAQNMSSIISTLLMSISEIFIVILIYSMMIYVDWKITLLLTIFLLFNGLIIIKVISPRIRYEGKEREIHQAHFYKILFTTFGNFKLIKLHSNKESILDKFSIISENFALSNVKSETYGYIPRLYLEALSFITIILIVLYLLIQNSTTLSQSISTLVLFVLSLYRLLPSANRIISNYNSFLFHYQAFDIIYKDLMFYTEKFGFDKIDFNNKIELKNVTFFYKKNHSVVNNINLEINKNDRIGLIGESGSGKSTLVDIIMGLYQLNKGKIIIDNNELTEQNLLSWRTKFSYIPQQIFLFEGSVSENIAFGKPIIDSKIIECLEKVNLLEHLNKFHEGVNTNVGENGVKLSGGQKQRIAIARALYADKEILVLDEATSALDNDTEAQIIKEIYDLIDNKTLIVIAHRLNTIESCNKVFEITNAEVRRIR